MKSIFFLLGSIVLILIILAIMGVIDVSGLFPKTQVTNEVVEVVIEPRVPGYNRFYLPRLWAGRRYWDNSPNVVVVDGGRNCRGRGCGRRGPRGPPGPPGPPGPVPPPPPPPPVVPEEPGPVIPDVTPDIPPIVPDSIPDIPIPPPGPPAPPAPPIPEPPAPPAPPAPEPPSDTTEGFAVRHRDRSSAPATTYPGQFTFNSQSSTLQGYEY